MKVILTAWDGHSHASAEKLIEAGKLLGLTAVGYCNYDMKLGYNIIFAGQATEETEWLENATLEQLKNPGEFSYTRSEE